MMQIGQYCSYIYYRFMFKVLDWLVLFNEKINAVPALEADVVGHCPRAQSELGRH